MTNKMQPARGTRDILADEYRQFSYVVNKAKEISSCYGFEEISTPIFEFTEVFKKTLGEDSDVVGKEMYIFRDKGDEELCLRPEFTAGIARAFISEGLANQIPLKLFSTGPLFRYERPQKGRQRQFHQVNFEMIGIAAPLADVELIAFACNFLKALGIRDKVSLELNSLGDTESRLKYRTALVEYLSKYVNDLSEDSKIRFGKNPMRILDSKDERDKKIVHDAPAIPNYYSDEAKKFLALLEENLSLLGIDYKINPKLVRGLDYYNHTVFEFTTELLGAQNTVLAGGRYDGLISNMGGPSTPSVGCAAGIERLMALLDIKIAAKRPVVIVPIGEKAEREAILLTEILRCNNIYTELGYSGNATKRLKKAGNMNAKFAVIFGDDEIAKNIVKLKDFDTGTEKEVQISMLPDLLM